MSRQETLQEETGTSDGGRDYGFTGEEDGVNARSPFTALLKAPQLASSSRCRPLMPLELKDSASRKQSAIDSFWKSDNDLVNVTV